MCSRGHVVRNVGSNDVVAEVEPGGVGVASEPRRRGSLVTFDGPGKRPNSAKCT